MADPIEELRTAAAALPPARPEMASYLAKVHECAYTVTDGDVEALLEVGCTEDEVFEQTVGVAIREGLRRFDRAQEILG